VDPKAHGLGYLYPPTTPNGPDDQPWTWEAWDWILRDAIGLRAKAPRWLHVPAMMRMVLSTPLLLERLNRGTRPYNFLLCPLVDAVVGYPKGVDRNRFTLIAPFTKDRAAWLRLSCINACDGHTFELSLEQDPRGSKVIPQTYGYVLRLYPFHAESKSLGADGAPCSERTRGLLERASIDAGHHHFVGKETDRRWEYGEDLSLMHFKAVEYRPVGRKTVADRALREKIASSGIRELMRKTGLSQHTVESLRRGQRVRHTTIERVLAAFRG
jgi:hypothetical protein